MTTLAVQEVRVRIADDQLVVRCRAGDTEAFSQVYAQYGAQVFRHAWYLLNDRDDADDARQETFIRAFRAFPRFRNDCSLLTWLLTICSNVCRDRAKIRERRAEVLYDPVDPPEYVRTVEGGVDPFDATVSADDADLLMRIVKNMPHDARNLIVMHELEGMSCSEIGSILGISAASAKLRIFRARKRLRERLESVYRTGDAQ
ncbi:MAG: sigma-70 family RNA polymerase sigma factor [Armatimonadetes bacterium]|nr:sigma-70 family RNA polymerase sigma factor [Armatimonadota bacterium]MDE2207384.1 sigma-70 family RNA polymerase sigma factor [Armatimonadota bacterium]